MRVRSRATTSPTGSAMFRLPPDAFLWSLPSSRPDGRTWPRPGAPPAPGERTFRLAGPTAGPHLAGGGVANATPAQQTGGFLTSYG